VIVLGLWWAANLLFSARRVLKLVRRARAQKIPVPHFSGSIFAPDQESLMAFAFTMVVALFSLGNLIVYLRRLPIDWVAPLAAASVLLTACALVAVLILRGLLRASQGTYELLERDILLQRLDSREISTRFTSYTLGAETTAWLDELLAGLKEENEALAKQREDSRGNLSEIEKIDPQYSVERKARTKKVVADLSQGIQRHKAHLLQMQLRMDAFFTIHKTTKEHEALRHWITTFRERIEDGTKIVLSSRELLAAADRAIK
jgi:hypothetical protein